MPSFHRPRTFSVIMVIFAVLAFAPAAAHAQRQDPPKPKKVEKEEANPLPTAKFEGGIGFTPFGAANGLAIRGAIAIFPAQFGVIARLSAHRAAAGTRGNLLSFDPPEKRVVDRAIMLGSRLQSDYDAVFTAGLGVGQLWGQRLNKSGDRFVDVEQQIGIAAEIGAYMPHRNSGIGTVIMANVNRDDFIVGFIVTFYAGF
ncbi:MAG: hypothetical protein R2832_14900 [Rhodothermales bacterium]